MVEKASGRRVRFEFERRYRRIRARRDPRLCILGGTNTLYIRATFYITLSGTCMMCLLLMTANVEIILQHDLTAAMAIMSNRTAMKISVTLVGRRLTRQKRAYVVLP